MNSTTTPLSIDPSCRPLRRTDLVVHEIDGEALVYDATSADTHRLNPTAWFIWNACDGDHDAHAVAAEVGEVYDVALDAAEQHVRRMFEAFAERKLIKT